MDLVQRETCAEYFRRRLAEGWNCIHLKGHNAVLLSPEGFRRELDLRGDTLTLRPNADGYYTFWKLSGGTDHYALVDEATPDEDATYIYRDDNAYGKDSFTFPVSGSPEGIILKVTAFMRVKNIGIHPDWNAGKLFVRISGTDYSGSWEPFPASYTNKSYEWTTNPATGNPWTWDEIDALEVGIHKGTITDEIRITQVYVEVDYTTVTEKSSSDTGSGIDAKASGNPLATYSRSETGSGVEAKASGNPLATLSGAETGSGVDALYSLETPEAKASSDAGSGVEGTPVQSAVLAGSETGSGIEALIARLLVAVDTGYGVEAGDVEVEDLLKDLFASELGQGSDSLTAKIETPTKGGGMKLWN